jgi:branched-chain amino acid transport system substrate-binding protein
VEAQIYAQHILKTNPNARIAVLSQNDDAGKDYVTGFRAGLGERGVKQIIAEVTYEVSDSTVDSQITTLKASGAEVFFLMAVPKFAAQALRKTSDLGWRPTIYLSNVSSSIAAVMVPAGVEKAVGVISTAYYKDPTDPTWANDPAMNEWRLFMRRYYSDGDVADALNVAGYNSAQVLVHVLKACGDNLTRENVMKQAASLKDLQMPLGLPGITLSTGPNDFAPGKSMQLERFDGKTWVRFGEVFTASAKP